MGYQVSGILFLVGPIFSFLFFVKTFLHVYTHNEDNKIGFVVIDE